MKPPAPGPLVSQSAPKERDQPPGSVRSPSASCCQSSLPRRFCLPLRFGEGSTSRISFRPPGFLLVFHTPFPRLFSSFKNAAWSASRCLGFLVSSRCKVVLYLSVTGTTFGCLFISGDEGIPIPSPFKVGPKRHSRYNFFSPQKTPENFCT